MVLLDPLNSVLFVATSVATFDQRCVKLLRFTLTLACAESIPSLFPTDLSRAPAKFRASMLLRKVEKRLWFSMAKVISFKHGAGERTVNTY